MSDSPLEATEQEIKKEPKKSLVVIAIVSIFEIILGTVVVMNTGNLGEAFLRSAGYIIIGLGVAGLVLYAVFRKRNKT